MSVSAVELRAARLERQRARIQKAREQVDRAVARVVEAQESLAGEGAEPVEPGVAARGVVLAVDASGRAKSLAPQIAVALGAVVVLGVVFVVVRRRRAARHHEEL